MTFLKLYLKLVGVAAILFGIASLFYLLTFRDPVLTMQDSNRIIHRLDAVKNGDDEKRQILVEEIMYGKESNFWHLMLERAAEALILAGVMLLTVEAFTRFNSSRELTASAEEASRNVWQALSKRLVPGEICVEIEKILKSDVCRIRPVYRITFMSGNTYVGLPDGQIVVKRELSYRLLNITGGWVKYPIHLSILSHTGNHNVSNKKGEQFVLPMIQAVTIHHEPAPIGEGERQEFSKTVTLPKMKGVDDAWEVYTDVEEVFNLTDRALYVLTSPCYELELHVVNLIPHLVEVQEENVYLTADRDRLTRTDNHQQWVCDGGLLSGTALSLSWKAVAKSQPANVSTQNLGRTRQRRRH